MWICTVQVLLYSHAPFTNCSQRQIATGEVYFSVPDPKNPYIFVLIRIQVRIRNYLYESGSVIFCTDPISDPSINKQHNRGTSKVNMYCSTYMSMKLTWLYPQLFMVSSSERSPWWMKTFHLLFVNNAVNLSTACSITESQVLWHWIRQ